MDPLNLTPPAIVGESEAGRSQKVRYSLEGLVNGLNRSTFDMAELLHEVASKKYYSSWGFNTATEYYKSLDLKPRKAQYLARIVEVMDKVGASRADYEKLGIAKLREITSLDPDGQYNEPEGEGMVPLSTYIKGFVAAGTSMSLDTVKEHVKSLKGLVGEDELVFMNFSIKRSVKEQVLLPALEKAGIALGTTARDEEGNALEPSDGRKLEVLAISYLTEA